MHADSGLLLLDPRHAMQAVHGVLIYCWLHELILEIGDQQQCHKHWMAPALFVVCIIDKRILENPLGWKIGFFSI